VGRLDQSHRVPRAYDGKLPLRDGVTDADFAEAQEWLDKLKGTPQ